eukprot:TRINITY_DN2425_c0_g1_i1.p1 TRINITY_DN2425_c0_g1~~TRINITY_DN2425_c0_g1_i1.p1  ORF type:complete len:652 (+),score=59.19 TRINITY_DN2425_c0_g1_i1:3037-4992(+)
MLWPYIFSKTLPIQQNLRSQISRYLQIQPTAMLLPYRYLLLHLLSFDRTTSIQSSLGLQVVIQRTILYLPCALDCRAINLLNLLTFLITNQVLTAWNAQWSALTLVCHFRGFVCHITGLKNSRLLAALVRSNFVSTLKNREMLQVLDLSHNKLDQESLLKVLEFCKGCGSLQELCLISASEDDSKLGEVVYMELCELLIHCSSLQVLGFNVGKVVEAQKGLAKNIETALIHNMSLVKWNQTEPTTTEYKKYLAANLWISANVGEGLEGIETLPEEVREIVDKKLALAKQYSNSARKPPQKMEIIREATYEEDEESKSASKIQYEYGSVITIQNEEIPQPFQDTNFMENLIKNVEVNCKKNYEELEKKLENISEFAKLKMNQTEKLAAEAIEATKEIQELKLENVELKRHIQAILDKVNALEKERNEDLKQIVLKEELVALREEVKAEVSEVTTLKIAAIEENIPECLANCSNEITAALKERVEKMEVALVDIQESTSNSSALQRAEAAHKRTEELSKQFKKVKEDLDKKLSDENNIWSGKFSQYEKKIEAVQRSQEILRKQAGQFQAKTQASLKELTEAKTTSNSQGNPAEMLKTLPEFTALKQKTSQALVIFNIRQAKLEQNSSTRDYNQGKCQGHQKGDRDDFIADKEF